MEKNSMKKFYFFSILFLVSFTTALADPVDSLTAKNVAQIFLQQKSIISVDNNTSLKSARLNSLLTSAVTESESNEFYIFNIENKGGFIIISAEDCAFPVLGYGENGSFDPNNVPPNMQNWLDGYNQKIRYASDNNISATEEIKTQWENLLSGANIISSTESAATVGPLIETTWDQSPYYNDLCPYDNVEKGTAVTGCVATAMAQVMKYWEYPVTGTGSHSYYDSTCGTLSADFASTTYNWNNMPNALSGSSSAAEVEAVATLMYHCGVSVEMDYGVSSSGAYVIDDGGWWSDYCAENALKNYFGYKSTLQGLEKANYSNSDWVDLLKTELDESRPILYAGYTSGTNSSGHAFVCDGYNSDDYFHFNWGWSGSYDGYFTLDALEPISGYLFSTDQQAIIGIKPDEIEGIDLTYNSYSLNINSTVIDVSVVVKNIGNTNSGAFNVAFYLSSDASVSTSDYLIGTKSVSGLNSGSTFSLSLSEDVETVTPEIPDGNYYVGYIIDYLDAVDEVTETNNSYSFTSDQVELYRLPNLTYNSSENSFTINNYDVTINLQAINDDDYASEVCGIGFFLSSDKSVSVASDYLLGTVSLEALNAGETSNKSFSANVLEKFPDLPEGTYYLGYYIDYLGSVEESDETDNTYIYTTKTLQHTLYSNLTYNSGSADLEVLASEINVSVEVMNNGEKTSSSCRLGCYFSKDANITTSDYLAGYISLSQIAVGSSVTKTISVNPESIGSNLTEGNYYIGFFIDYSGLIEELDETDNTYAFADQPYYYCPPDIAEYNKSICEGESISFQGEEFTETGSYEFTYESQTGCDSILVLNLTVHPVYNIQLNEVICLGETYTVGATKYSESGSYTQYLTSQYGCDSTVTLSLEVVEPVEVEVNQSICEGDSYEVGGIKYSETGTYTNQLTSSVGCDSTVILNLTVHALSDTLLVKNICSNDSIMIGDSAYYETGIYTNILTNRFGCDSVVTLDLTVNPSYTKVFTDTICEGDSVWFDGLAYSESGTFINAYSTQIGCDSSRILNLTVNPVHDTLLSVSLCEGDSIKVGNSYYSETGVYVENLSNQFGCDSIVTLDLVVNPVNETVLDTMICEGDSIVIGTSVYKSTGSYTDVLSNRFGCDSTVYLTLTVNPTQAVDIHEDICDGSVFNLGTMQYSESGIYTYTFNNQYGCDSIVTLYLNVMALPEIDLGDDFILFSSETATLDAGSGFASYLWNTGETTQYISISSKQGLGTHNYSVTVTNYNQCSSADEVEIKIYDDSPTKNEDPFLKLFPNPSNGVIQLIIGDVTGKYTIKISSENGNMVYNKEFISIGSKFLKTIDLSFLSSGYYSLLMIADNGIASEKFIIIEK